MLTTAQLFLTFGNQSVYFIVMSAASVVRLRLETFASCVNRSTTFYQHFAGNTDLVEECLRGIHEAGGTLSERAIDTLRGPAPGQARCELCRG
jgi:hypothetical protein